MRIFSKAHGLIIGLGMSAAAHSEPNLATVQKIDELTCIVQSPGNESFDGWQVLLPVTLARKPVPLENHDYTMTLGQQELEVKAKDHAGKTLTVSAYLESYHARKGQEAAQFRCVTVKLEYEGIPSKYTCADRPADPFNDPTRSWAKAAIGDDGFPKYVIRAFRFDLSNTPAGDLVFSCVRK